VHAIFALLVTKSHIPLSATEMLKVSWLSLEIPIAGSLSLLPIDSG
jgi:hypothetical protein